MKINNIFYSIQGEGIHIGKPTIFIRFAGCPFRCPYCDEPPALTTENASDFDLSNLMHVLKKQFIERYSCYNIEYTGGSPEIQDREDMELLSLYIKENFPRSLLSMQMSGGLKISKRLWNIIDSHKIDFKEKECNIPFIIDINKLTSRDEVKFVLDADGSNWQWFLEKVERFDNSNVNIIVSPKSDLHSDAYRELLNAKILTEKIMRAGINANIQVLPRLQQLYWYNEKGK